MRMVEMKPCVVQIRSSQKPVILEQLTLVGQLAILRTPSGIRIRNKVWSSKHGAKQLIGTSGHRHLRRARAEILASGRINLTKGWPLLDYAQRIFGIQLFPNSDDVIIPLKKHQQHKKEI
jgi:hypothetical protein